jgi:hypothetical protein
MRKPNYRGWVFTDKVAIYTHFGSPMYGAVYGLAEMPLLYALENKLKLIVKTPDGTVVYNSAKEWIDGAEKIKMYKNFDIPFFLYRKSILPDLKKFKEKQKKEKKIIRIETNGEYLIKCLQELKNRPEDYQRVKSKVQMSLF